MWFLCKHYVISRRHSHDYTAPVIKLVPSNKTQPTLQSVKWWLPVLLPSSNFSHNRCGLTPRRRSSVATIAAAINQIPLEYNKLYSQLPIWYPSMPLTKSTFSQMRQSWVWKPQWNKNNEIGTAAVIKQVSSEHIHPQSWNGSSKVDAAAVIKQALLEQKQPTPEVPIWRLLMPLS